MNINRNIFYIIILIIIFAAVGAIITYFTLQRNKEGFLLDSPEKNYILSAKLLDGYANMPIRGCAYPLYPTCDNRGFPGLDIPPVPLTGCGTSFMYPNGVESPTSCRDCVIAQEYIPYS